MIKFINMDVDLGIWEVILKTFLTTTQLDAKKLQFLDANSYN